MQHKVTAQIGSTQISIETGKIAKLADGAVIVSCGDTIVLVSAVSATTNQGRPGLVPAHRRLPRKSGGRRQISRRLLQTRRPSVRKGNAHLPHDGSSAASALPRRLSLRHADHLDPAQRRWRERSRYSRDQRRLRRADASPTFRSPARSAPCASAASMASSSPTRPTTEREQSDLDLVYVGTENDVIMIEGAAAGNARRGIHQGARVRARTCARNDPHPEGTRGASRQAEARDAADDGEPGDPRSRLSASPATASKARSTTEGKVDAQQSGQRLEAKK